MYFLSNFKATDGLSHSKPFKSDFKKIIIIYITKYFILFHFTNFKIDYCLSPRDSLPSFKDSTKHHLWEVRFLSLCTVTPPFGQKKNGPFFLWSEEWASFHRPKFLVPSSIRYQYNYVCIAHYDSLSFIAQVRVCLCVRVGGEGEGGGIGVKKVNYGKLWDYGDLLTTH